MNRAKNASLVFCLFVLYCVVLSQGLKATGASAFFGALAAVPLTVHLYHRIWPPSRVSGEQRRSRGFASRCEVEQAVTGPGLRRTVGSTDEE